ncbi:uncharacterized protein LOC126894070 [Daktulosphaira vitifoliae]|uniref:uncharacterized protein LOC126894070 n=1 Tax=Daktulosphaira vitifoliae TaxID=58002 RepID=UPI0021AA3653|nr:uncharacterized protein LOC126894070 [Daktulosphaira vitifoliae]
MMNIQFIILLFAYCIISTFCVPIIFNDGLSKTEDSPKEHDDIPNNNENSPKEHDDILNNNENSPKEHDDILNNNENTPKEHYEMPNNNEDTPKEQVEMPENHNLSVIQIVWNRVKSILLLADSYNDNKIAFKDMVEVCRKEYGKDISDDYEDMKDTEITMDFAMTLFYDGYGEHLKKLTIDLGRLANKDGYIPTLFVRILFYHYKLDSHILNEILQSLDTKDNLVEENDEISINFARKLLFEDYGDQVKQTADFVKFSSIKDHISAVELSTLLLLCNFGDKMQNELLGIMAKVNDEYIKHEDLVKHLM